MGRRTASNTDHIETFDVLRVEPLLHWTPVRNGLVVFSSEKVTGQLIMKEQVGLNHTGPRFGLLPF